MILGGVVETKLTTITTIYKLANYEERLSLHNFHFEWQHTVTKRLVF